MGGQHPVSIPVHLHFVHLQGPAFPVSMMVSMTVSMMGNHFGSGVRTKVIFPIGSFVLPLSRSLPVPATW